jgi:hypothetical protein
MFKTLWDFNWSENHLGETKAANKRGRVGEAGCHSSPPAAHPAPLQMHPGGKLVASDNLPQPDPAQLPIQPERYTASSSPSFKYHLGSFSQFNNCFVKDSFFLFLSWKRKQGSLSKEYELLHGTASWLQRASACLDEGKPQLSIKHEEVSEPPQGAMLKTNWKILIHATYY